MHFWNYYYYFFSFSSFFFFMAHRHRKRSPVPSMVQMNPVFRTRSSDLSYLHCYPLDWCRIKATSWEACFCHSWTLFQTSLCSRPTPFLPLLPLLVALWWCPLWKSDSAGESLFVNMLLLALPGFLSSWTICLSVCFHIFLHAQCAYIEELEVETWVCYYFPFKVNNRFC